MTDFGVFWFGVTKGGRPKQYLIYKIIYKTYGPKLIKSFIITPFSTIKLKFEKLVHLLRFLFS